MPQGLAGSLLLVIVEGIGGSQFRRNPQGEFKAGEEPFQRDLIQQLVLQVHQLQQFLLPSSVQCLSEFSFNFHNLLSYLPALRLLAESLVQRQHVIPHKNLSGSYSFRFFSLICDAIFTYCCFQSHFRQSRNPLELPAHLQPKSCPHCRRLASETLACGRVCGQMCLVKEAAVTVPLSPAFPFVLRRVLEIGPNPL